MNIPTFAKVLICKISGLHYRHPQLCILLVRFLVYRSLLHRQHCLLVVVSVSIKPFCWFRMCIALVDHPTSVRMHVHMWAMIRMLGSHSTHWATTPLFFVAFDLVQLQLAQRFCRLSCYTSPFQFLKRDNQGACTPKPDPLQSKKPRIFD